MLSSLESDDGLDTSLPVSVTRWITTDPPSPSRRGSSSTDLPSLPRCFHRRRVVTLERNASVTKHWRQHTAAYRWPARHSRLTRRRVSGIKTSMHCVHADYTDELSRRVDRAASPLHRWHLLLGVKLDVADKTQLMWLCNELYRVYTSPPQGHWRQSWTVLKTWLFDCAEAPLRTFV